jgi:hypothetical protein
LEDLYFVVVPNMQLTADAKAVILNYLKDGQREMALQYISRTFHTGHYDSQKLLESVEREFSQELKGFLPSKKFDANACSGCLSKLLKIISILLIIVAAGIFALGYYFIDLFGKEWNNRQMQVIVKDYFYPYNDSTSARPIYEFEKDGKVELDTNSMPYNTSVYQIGDTINVFAHDLGFGLDTETITRLEERQTVFYYIGVSIITIALIFLAASAVFKIRPPSKETAGRYNK